MARYRDPATGAERAKAILAVAAVHLGMAAAILFSTNAAVIPPTGQPPIQMVDVTLPPPPPPPPKPAPTPDREAGAAGRKADPAPTVLPPPRIVLPSPNPVPAAPVAGTGSAANAGAAASGTGTGAGGTGDGRGGGGAGGGGIGEDARLLSGGLTRRDYRDLRRFDAPGGRAMLAILIGPDGRVVECSIHRSSGNPALDAALCAILMPRMRWAPARDRNGRALTVGLYYVATWGRD